MRCYVVGHEHDLESLRDLFPDGGDDGTWFGKDDDGTFLMLPGLEGKDGAAVYDAALTSLTLKLGLALLLDESLRPVTLAGHFRAPTGKSLQIVLADGIESRSRVGTPTITVSGVPAAEPISPVPGYEKVAAANENVAEVLNLYGQTGLDWNDLYKVFEIIRDDVGGGPALADMGWASKAEFSAFTASANRSDVSGSGARHARQSGAPPKKTMTLLEGQALIRRIAKAWLKSH